MDVYEEACNRYIDGMYRIAFLALGDGEKAEQTVTAVCKAGVRTCYSCTDTHEICLRFISDLYRRCRTQQSDPNPASLPEPLRSLSTDDRFLLSLRAVFGLTETELAAVIGECSPA